MRIVSNASRRLRLLAPSRSAVPGFFTHVHSDPKGYGGLLAATQRLRGSVYLEDGAIKPHELTDGRHCLDIDRVSWHLLALDRDNQVCGCVRYREYSGDESFSNLSVSQSALARSRRFGANLEAAVREELLLASELDVPFVETGGWALAEEIRGTTEALRMALAVYGLSQALGGAVGISAATYRHCSASILRRIGGQPLEYSGSPLPPYHDPQYRCQMEALRFYSWAPNPRFSGWIEEVKAELRTVPVLTNGASCPLWPVSRRSRMLRPSVPFEPRRAAYAGFSLAVR
jgi:hypothetical protein